MNSLKQNINGVFNVIVLKESSNIFVKVLQTHMIIIWVFTRMKVETMATVLTYSFILWFLL